MAGTISLEVPAVELEDEKSNGAAKLVEAFDATPRDTLLSKIIADRYRVEELIGSGGWGRVYRVLHIGLNQSMALKLLHSSHVFDREKLARFKQEAEAVSALDHPNICRVIDFAEGPEGQPCMVMELLVGKRLDEIIKEKSKLTLPDVLNIGVQLCSALVAAHKKGIIHRDLKPANIMLVEENADTEPTRVR
jgi:serine/threonine-protein kinase